MYPSVFKGENMFSFKRNKYLGDYLVSAKLKWDQCMDDQSHLVLQVIGHQIEPRMALGWGLLSLFSPFRYFRIFQHC